MAPPISSARIEVIRMSAQEVESNKEKNWITVDILYGNQSQKFDFNIHFTIRKVLEESIKAFKLQPPTENYQLFYENTQLSDLNKSLLDYQIPEGAKLVMAHVHVVG